MSITSITADKIVEAAANCDTLKVLEPALVGEERRQNELLLFIKPEAFLLPNLDFSEKVVELIFKKLGEFGAQVDGISVINGRVLDEQEIMNRHYGFINVLSRSASKLLDDRDKKSIEEALGISLNQYTLLGGHEYLERYPDENSVDLDNLWFTGKSTKIRSGFYVKPARKENQDLVLVNGFHPEQLAHYTRPTHKIVLMLLHSDTDWSVLRNEMVGTTFPEKAASGSIRGTLYAHAPEYGFESVTIANNCVHLSAGPFEGMFEITNFFGKIMGLHLEQQPPLVLKQLLKAGIDYSQAIKVLDNPVIPLPDKSTDLFTATEDMNTREAVDLYRQSV